MSKMSLKAKLMLGFGVVALLLACLGGIAWYAMSSASGGFSDYRAMARDTNIAGRVQANFLLIRVYLKDFIQTGNVKDIDEINDGMEKTKALVADAKGQITNVERLTLITGIEKNISEYEKAFGEFSAADKIEKEGVEKGLNVIGASMEKEFTQFLASANTDGEVATVYNGSMALRSLLLGRLYMVKYLENNEKELADRARSELATCGKGLEDLGKTVVHEGRKKMLASIQEDHGKYLNTFNEVIKSLVLQNDIVTNRLNELGPKIADDAETIKLGCLKEQEELGPKLQKRNEEITLIVQVGALLGIAFSLLLAWTLSSRITAQVLQIVNGLTTGADQTASAAGQVAQSSQAMASGASEQASSLEETSASLEEMTSMTKQNAENASQAMNHMIQAKETIGGMVKATKEMSEAIAEIKSSADQTAKIVKTIDEIAFQTNLLALNAAVEAARAGDAGKGFAVVAEEVRNLAQRSAEAAKNTSSLIEESVHNADNGVLVTQRVAEALQQTVDKAEKVDMLIHEIAAASKEQAQGIEQISTAVLQMDQVTQSNAANSEESASASEELSAQAEEMNRMMVELNTIVNGERGSVNQLAQRDTKPRAPQKAARSPHPLKLTEQRRPALITSATSEHAVVKAQQVIPLDDEDMNDF